MNSLEIIDQLEENRKTFKALLEDVPHKIINWKPAEDEWSLLEIVCHLHDEEREDFRNRIKLVLEDPTRPLPKFDPVHWVRERNYADEDYVKKLTAFLEERKDSVKWLKTLEEPKWENAYQHKKHGPMSAELFLNNWLGHDYLHFRQIVKNKFLYLKEHVDTPLDYAGEW